MVFEIQAVLLKILNSLTRKLHLEWPMCKTLKATLLSAKRGITKSDLLMQTFKFYQHGKPPALIPSVKKTLTSPWGQTGST